MDEVTITRLINGPEAFTPDGEFLLGEIARARVLRRRRLLRPRARGRGRDGQADGGVDRRGRAVARRVGDGHAALRRALPLARLHAQAHARGLRDLLRHQVPGPRAPGRAAAARLAGLRLAPRARRRVRREVRLGAGELVRGERGATATRRCARAAGPGSTGRPRSAPSIAATPRGAPRCSTRPRSPSSRSAGRARAALLERLCDNRVVARRRARSPTRRCSTAAAGSSATSRSRGSSEDRFWIVTGTAFGTPRPRLDRSHARRRRRWWRTSPRAGPASGCGARGRATSSPPLHARPARLPVHELRERSRSATCRCARCGSPTSASSAGSSTARWSSASALWRTLWEAGEPHGLVAGGYRAIDSLRLEKGYRVWGADITPDDTPYEGGARLRGQARPRLHRPRRAGGRRRAGPAAVLRRARRPALGRARQRAGARRAARSAGVSRAAATGTRSAPRSPTPICPPSTPSRAPRWRSRCSGSGSTERCEPSRCSIQKAHECAAKVSSEWRLPTPRP